jgi:hypothetical protein
MYGKTCYRYVQSWSSLQCISQVLVLTEPSQSHCTVQGLQWDVILKFLMVPYAMFGARGYMQRFCGQQ